MTTHSQAESSLQNMKAVSYTHLFSDMSSAQLENYLNIKAAKVTATAGSKLTGLDFKAVRAGEAVFADISGNISGLAFEDMTLDLSSYGGSSVGLIGHLQGSGSDLNFTNITIKGLSLIHISMWVVRSCTTMVPLRTLR